MPHMSLRNFGDLGTLGHRTAGGSGGKYRNRKRNQRNFVFIANPSRTKLRYRIGDRTPWGEGYTP